MGFNPVIPVGNLVAYSRGGGWGKETPFEGSSRVAIIRGADFPSVAQGSYGDLPVRYEKDSKVNSVALRAGDIVLENSGGTDSRPTGRTVFVTNELIDAYDCPVIPASFCRLLRFDNRANSEFVYYWLQEMYSAGRTWGYQNRSTGLSNFQYKVFADSELLPDLPIEVQSKIASVLSAFEKKIRENKRLNDYLATLIDLEFSKRFGSPVPTTSLKNVLEISTKSLKPQQHAGETWEHYSIPAFDGMHWPILELADGIKSNKYIVDRNSILISKLNPSIKRMWIPVCLTDKAVCSTEFIVYKPVEPRHKSFYCAAINANNFTAFLLEHVTGSTGSRQRAQPKATLDYPMPNPCRTAIGAFCDFADPIYRQIEIAEIESQRLGSLRNALLPKLMSGEIDVSSVKLPTPPNHHC